MSETDKPARPRQLTMAGGFVIGGSILLVLSIFDTFTTLHSVEMRDEITKVVTSPTGEGFGLSVSEALSVMRVGLLIAAACAAATAVLGVYALQRSRVARLALTILAVPILLTSPLTGGLIGALVAASILMLWSGPARDWFAGRAVREVAPTIAPGESHQGPWEETMPSAQDRDQGNEQDPVPPGPDETSPAPQDSPTASSLSTAVPSTEPAATSGFGERAASRADPVATDWLPTPYPVLAQRTAVPLSVKVACILTWVFSGVVALSFAGTLVALVVAQDRIVNYMVKSPEFQRSNLEQSMLLPALWVGVLMFLSWAVGACALAWFTWRRHDWARWLLAASAAAATMAALFAFPVGLPHQLAAVVTITGLFSASARAWFGPRPWSPGPPPAPPGSHLRGPPPPREYPSGAHPPGGPGPDHETSAPAGKPPVW